MAVGTGELTASFKGREQEMLVALFGDEKVNLTTTSARKVLEEAYSNTFPEETLFVASTWGYRPQLIDALKKVRLGAEMPHPLPPIQTFNV